MRAYSISGTAYNNSCYTNDPVELAKYVAELAKKAPEKSTILIGVTDIPEALFNDYPEFEGFQLKGPVNTGGE